MLIAFLTGALATVFYVIGFLEAGTGHGSYATLFALSSPILLPPFNLLPPIPIGLWALIGFLSRSRSRAGRFAFYSLIGSNLAVFAAFWSYAALHSRNLEDANFFYFKGDLMVGMIGYVILHITAWSAHFLSRRQPLPGKEVAED